MGTQGAATPSSMQPGDTGALGSSTANPNGLSGGSTGGYATDTTKTTTMTSGGDVVTSSGRSWGWLGLFGLLGLFGFRRVRRDTEYVTNTPTQPRV
jgi:MYXO-CTERM domain-containing protein